MSQLVADYILERLREWDIHRIYGYREVCSATSIGLIDPGA